ncbi:MAG: UvrD-helicase domain-containing protein [Elusimicrobiaceae bacterium]|nr:UvrD-helicase domain-containing protein [Elusimicrobiaceae bacterium]
MNREDRLRVQTQLGKNMVVEAGAGTGKTTLLIHRLCLCVLAQATPVEKLVALTFTEKAAAEIKTRFIFKLQHLIEALSTGEEDRTLTLLREHFHVPDADLLVRAQTALSRLDRASIGTIHSFCAEILKTFPLEAALSPGAQIDSGQKADRLFQARWNHFLDEELGEHAPRAQAWKEVLGKISLAQLQAFAWELSCLKPVEYDYYSHRRMLAQLCREKSAQAQQLCDTYLSAGKKTRVLETALQWAQKSLQATALFLNQEPFQEPEDESFSLPANPYKDWDPDDFDQARSLVTFAQKVAVPVQKIFLLAQSLVGPVARQVRADCQAQGVLSFDDLIITTRNLLKTNLYVRRLLKEKIEALFIDEFQDTDPIQGELLLFLAEEKPGTAQSWQEVRLQPGKLFVVGDPKQSIYRFRGADITAYELFTDLILKQGGEKCFLRRNFRSTCGIVETANQICSRAMIEQTAFQPAYEPIFTPRSSNGPDVSWLFVSPDSSQEGQADDYRHNQAEQIARWILQNVGTLKLADGRPLAYKDIALLTRVGTTTRIYTDALRRYNIPFDTQTDKDFFHKQEINDLLLLLRLVADNDDKIALAGVLRSPFGAQTDEHIYQLSRAGQLTLSALATREQTTALAAQIKHFTQLAGRVPVHELVGHILQETFFPEVCAAAYDGEKTLSYLQQFERWVAQYQAQENGSLLSFLADVQIRVDQSPDDFTLPPADEAADAVSILTVHKSKGLEFPVVLLADLSRKETAVAAHPATHLFSWQYTMYGLRAGNICDVNLAFLEEEQKKHSRCEEVRILYVALTRAKEKLILVADGRKGAAQAASAFVAAGLFPDGSAPQVSTPDGELSIPVTYVPYQDPARFLYTHVAAGAQLPTYTTAQITAWKQAQQARVESYEHFRKQAHPLAPSELAENSLSTLQQQQGAELGSVCHRALELWTAGRVADISFACMQAAQQLGAPQQAESAETLLKPFIASDIFKEISCDKLLACEMPFSVPLKTGEVQSGVMDALLQRADGSLWIVDYKTDQVAPGQEAAWVDKKYRLQLNAYAHAAKQLFPGKAVRCSAVFIRTFAAVDL